MTKAAHVHKYQHVGGGCFIMTGECDDDFRCECGAEFTVFSDRREHINMPHTLTSDKTEKEAAEAVLEKARKRGKGKK